MRALFAATLALTSTIAVCGQAARGRQSKPTAQAIPWQSKPFDISVDTLPPRFIGHSVAAVYYALATQQPAPKDEFESTIDYRDRLARLSSSPLFGGIYRDSFLAFVFSPSSGTALSSHYDADLSVLDITLKFSISNVFGFSPSLLWALTERKMGSYTGRTSFGRAVRVSKFQYDSTELITDPDGLRLIGGIKPRGGSLLDGPVFKSGVFMPPSAARLQKPNVRALVIGKLTRDPVLSKTQRIEATVRSPVETSIIQTAVKLRVSEIWFYDFPTGNVLARFRFSIPPPVEGGLPQPMILGGHPNP